MDIIYAADDAMFLGSNFQYFSVPWDMHPRQAKELLYESRFIDAEEAARFGLVNRVFPAARPARRSDRLCRTHRQERSIPAAHD